MQRHLVIFGFSLSAFWQDLLNAWRGMLDWKAVAWLWPKQKIQLILPDGDMSISLGPKLVTSAGKGRANKLDSAGTVAVVLPEDIVLRCAINLPNLQVDELTAAVSLQVKSLSPYGADDSVWIFSIDAQSETGQQIHLVLTSRKLIAKHLADLQLVGSTISPEIWVSEDLQFGCKYLVVPGFGEDRRKRQELRGRWVSVLLLLVVAGLLVTIAVTPTFRLYQRYVLAQQALASLQQVAVPVLKERDIFARSSDQLDSVSAQTGKALSPMRTLALVTQALPDDTFLSGLRIQGAKVAISGQTANAAALMKQLGTMPELRDVTAPSPATRPLGAPKESFGIEFLLSAAQPEKTK